MDPVDKGAGRPSQLPEQSRPDGKNYLLAIGIDQYLHQPKLYNAVRDAQKVVEILTTQFQFEKENISTLYNDAATLDAIDGLLDKISDQIGERDSLIIYYSGHGEYNKKLDQGYWIPYDGQSGKRASFFDFDDLIRYIKAIKAFHIFIIADSCYSGSLFVDRSTAAASRLESIPSRWLLTAGRNEVVSDGKPDAHSPFADSLIYHLQNSNGDYLRVDELCIRVLNDVSSNARQTPRGEPMRDVGHRGAHSGRYPQR